MNAERKWQNRADPVFALVVRTCTPLSETLIGSGEDVKANHYNVKASRVRSQKNKTKNPHSNCGMSVMKACRRMRRTNQVAEVAFGVIRMLEKKQ